MINVLLNNSKEGSSIGLRGFLYFINNNYGYLYI
jgi:hypothetical protein